MNSKKNFAICHWSWEIGYIWHFLGKSGSFIDFSIWWLIASVPSSKWISSNLVKITTLFYHMQELCHQIFLKNAKWSSSPKASDRLQNLLWNSNLLIPNASILIVLELGQFICIQIWCGTMWVVFVATLIDSLSSSRIWKWKFRCLWPMF